MTKRSLALSIVLLLLQANALALDTLHLHIADMSAMRLQFNQTFITSQGRINLTEPNWFLHITNPAGAIVVLKNMEGRGDSVILEGATNTFLIKDSLLSDKNFTLQKNIRLTVRNPAGGAGKSFDIEINRSRIRPRGDNRPQAGGNEGGAGTTEYVPGSMVYDALALADTRTGPGTKRMILRYYVGADKLDSALSDNKFLEGVLAEVEGAVIQQSGGGLSALLSSIGGLDVTKYADGLAKFLVKRVKQELSVAFFERFKAIIDGTKDIRTVFPQTAILLDAIDVEVYDYERYIHNLREAFKADITTLHRNLPGIVTNHPEFFNRQKELKAALLSSCYIAGELESQSHPGDILANYPIEYLQETGLDFSGAIQTLQLLSASFRDTVSGEHARYWVPISALRLLVNNKLSLKYYLGLLRHEAKAKYNSVAFHNNNLVALLDEVAVRYDSVAAIYSAYKRYVLRFAEKTDALNQMIEEYRKIEKIDSAALEKYGTYLRAAVDMIQYCTQASTLPVIKDHTEIPDLDSLFNRYFQIAYSTSDLLTDISKKNYSAAINDLVRIYHLVRVKPLQENGTINKKAASASVLAQNRLAKYGSFMANVATAKTADEVAKAIEIAALPVGFSRVKRETIFNVAVNAYVGPFIGYERIRGVDSSGKVNSYGITAPIGVSLSKGYSVLFFNSNHRSSSSIFFSLFDIGAITAFRFTNDSTEKVPTIQLKDIISPGIYFSHGFGRTPISLNIGYQAGPVLRRVRLDENEYSKAYSRISISLVVDIPVFNLYSRSR